MENLHGFLAYFALAMMILFFILIIHQELLQKKIFKLGDSSVRGFSSRNAWLKRNGAALDGSQKALYEKYRRSRKLSFITAGLMFAFYLVSMLFK